MQARKYHHPPAFFFDTDHHSPSFDKYPEDNAAAAYGQLALDPYGDSFPDFDYTSDTS
jgi:hypothetical protein